MSILTIKKNLANMPLVLKTKSGVLHHQSTTRPTNELIIEQQWGPRAVTIDKFSGYLAMTFWELPENNKTYQVNMFKNYNGRMRVLGCTQNSVMQLRIYPDKKVALCAEEHNPDGDSVCYVLHKTEFTNRWNWNRRGDSGFFENSIIVHNDAEIKAAAKTMTKAEATGLIQFTCVRTASDVTHSDTIYYRTPTQAQFNKFSPKTQQELKEFFGDKWPKKPCDEPISPEKLIRFSYFKEKHEQASYKKKEELYESILSKFKDEIENAAPRSQIWFRDDNYIGCYVKHDTILNTTDYSRTMDWIFLYNHKTRSRSLCKYSWETKEISSLIPSLKALQDIYVGPRYSWILPANRRAAQAEYEQTRPAFAPIICGGLTIKELFANTNVGFLLDNNPAFQVRNLNLKHTRQCNQRISVSEAINSSCIQNWAFVFLASSNDQLLELLLKTQLYGLYQIAIEEKCEGDSSVFFDIDRKEMPRWGTTYMPYHGKQKNLIKMFGMTMDQLRFIDEKMKNAQFNSSGYGYWYYSNKLYVPHWMDKIIKIPLSSIDMDTFKKLCELSLEMQSTDLPNLSFEGLSPKGIVNTFYEYTGHIQEFKDYIRARAQLQEIQKRLPDTPGIFNEKLYPLKPKGGRKYIRFISGMPAQGEFRYELGRQVQKRLITWDDFVRFYSLKYPTAEFVRDEGVILTLNSIRMLKYLHDEAAYWVSFYNDAAKEEGFKVALERVKDYAYKDEETGLEIVLPTSVKDLKYEGDILHHCVGTYVDSIIGGKENIVFLRRSDMPAEPYYTIELVPPVDQRGNILDEHKKFIRQVHCVHNGCLTKEDQIRCYNQYHMPVYNKTFDIVKFLLNWAKAKKDIDPSSIKTQYPALCALR